MHEIKPTLRHAIRVWWSYLWRNLLMIVAAMVVGAIIGFVLGLILSIAGVSPETIKLIVMPVSALAGLALSILPIYWILGKDFGSFRLIIVSTAPEAPPV